MEEILSNCVYVGELISLARFLIDEPGSNLEYERALLELVTDAAQVSQLGEEKKQLATLIGLDMDLLYPRCSA